MGHKLFCNQKITGQEVIFNPKIKGQQLFNSIYYGYFFTLVRLFLQKLLKIIVLSHFCGYVDGVWIFSKGKITGQRVFFKEKIMGQKVSLEEKITGR